MRPERVAVTGGSGRLGRFVVDEIARHAAVSVLDVKPSRSPHSFVAVDVLDLDAVYGALAGHDAVIHLAAIDDAVAAPPKAYFETNVEGTFNVLQAAHERGIARAAIASSTAAYGFGRDNPNHPPRYLPIDEAHPLNPIGAYGLSKQVGEVIARGFARRGVTRIACLRPTLIVRPEVVAEIDNMAKLADGDPAGDPDFDTSGIAEPFGGPLAPGGSYVMPWDVARCFRLALEADLAPFELFVVAARDTIGPVGPVDSLARVAAEFGHVPELRKPELYERDPGASRLDSSHARALLGWEAEDAWPDIVEKYGGAPG